MSEPSSRKVDMWPLIGVSSAIESAILDIKNVLQDACQLWQREEDYDWDSSIYKVEQLDDQTRRVTYLVETALFGLKHKRTVTVHTMLPDEYVVAGDPSTFVTSYGILVDDGTYITRMPRKMSRHGLEQLNNLLVSCSMECDTIKALVSSEDWVRCDPVSKYLEMAEDHARKQQSCVAMVTSATKLAKLTTDFETIMSSCISHIASIKSDLEALEAKVKPIDAKELIRRDATVTAFETELIKQQDEAKARAAQLDDIEAKHIADRHAFYTECAELKCKQAAFDEKCKQMRADIDAPYLRIQASVDKTVQELATAETRLANLATELDDRITRHNRQQAQLEADQAKLIADRAEFESQKIAFEKLRAQLRSAL